MADPAPDLLTSLLRDVSRSFYLTLRILPRAVRPQIGLAYLLARTTDTIADTEVIPVEKRLHSLQRLSARILGTDSRPLDFGNLAPHQATPAERLLLLRCEESIALLGTLREGDLKLVRQVLNTITAGQQLDLERFGNATAQNIVALATEHDLDDYTYHVAGCVGEFWTRICRAHLFPQAPLEINELVVLSTRFGKGLQLVNILRDLPADLRKGRCYLPVVELRPAKLSPQDLLEPANEPRVRPVYEKQLRRAGAWLHDGWAYTNALPRRCVRVRLACAWPLLIGRETLQLLERGNFLHPNGRIKVSRKRVRQLIFRSVFLLPFPGPWRRMFPPGPQLRRA